MENERDENSELSSAGTGDQLAPPNLPGISLTPTPLSRGPFSAVYRGWDQVHRYDVVVKVLHTADDPVTADRFRREAAVMAKLRHPNIVALYQFKEGNPSALVMEYVPGQTLDALVGTDGRMDPARAAGIIEEVAAALDCIHAENIVHRDVKPSNILLPKNGPARLTDFGVAHIDTAAPLTIRGDMLGTIEYASPEQVKGTSTPDARSDVYSLAAVAYFALTGAPPFPAADNSTQAQLSVMHRQVFSDPPPLRLHRDDLSPGIDAAVRRGLAKDPADRYPSAGQLASALRSAVVAASGAPEAAAMAVTTRRTAALSGALAGAALVVGGAALVWNHEHSASLPAATPSSRSATAAQPGVQPFVKPSAPSATASSALPTKAKSTSGRTHALVAAVPTATAPPALSHALAPVHAQARIHAQTPAIHEAYVRPHTAAPIRVAKRAVTERPKFRRHSAMLAKATSPTPIFRAKSYASSEKALFAVYAEQTIMSNGRNSKPVSIPARMVTVDGQPVPSLVSGGWASIPAGKHLIAFIPAGETGYGRNPGLWVNLAPGTKINRQVLLPIASPIRMRPARELTASVPPLSAKSTVAAKPIETAKPTVTGKPTVTANAVVPVKQAVIASANLPKALASIAPPAVSWYTVSGWIVHNATAPKPTLVRTSAQWVKVDGNPVLALSMGQWAELPAGKHTVTFQPTHGVGVGVKTWDIDLSPQGHLDQQIPLPPMVVSPN